MTGRLTISDVIYGSGFLRFVVKENLGKLFMDIYINEVEQYISIYDK